MSEQVKDEIEVKLSYWECERIVLALIQMAHSIPSVSVFHTMKRLQDQEGALAHKIDDAAEKLVGKMREAL